MSTPPELWIVGSLNGLDDGLARQLKRAEAHCTGFVEDLRTVLRPYDLHVIPWEYDTGTRTRLPVAFNHAQVVLATRASAACLPEARHGENCVLVDRLAEMAEPLAALAGDAARRRDLGAAARATFLHAFTREARQGAFDTFIRACASPETT